MNKSKILTVLIAVIVVIIFASVSLTAIIISRGAVLTDEGIVLDSGVIRIQTEPVINDAIYYLDDVKISLQEKRINNLTEDQYNLRIEAPGFTSWERKIDVHQGSVVDVFAKLYPADFSLQQISNTEIDRAFFSDDSEFVFYTVLNSPITQENGLWRLKISQNRFLFNTIENTPEKVTEFSNDLIESLNNSNYSITISNDKLSAILHVQTENQYYLINSSNTLPNSYYSINKVIGFDPEAVTFFKDSENILVKNKELLYTLNLNTKITNIVSYQPTDSKVYGTSNAGIIIIDKTSGKIELFQNQVSQEIELKKTILPLNISEVHLPKNSTRYIIFKAQDIFYYLDIEKELLSTISLDTNLSFLEFAQNGKSAIFTKNDSVISFESKEIVSSGEFINNIYDTGFTLNSETDTIKFVPQSSHIIHYNNNTDHIVTISEVDGSNKYILLDNAGIKNSDFNLSVDGRSFVVLLADSYSSETESNKYNLYSLNLEEPAQKEN